MTEMNEWGNAERAVALSSRVRLARNYRDIPFPARMEAAQAEEVIARTVSTLDDPAYQCHRLNDRSDDEILHWVETHVISQDLAAARANGAVLIHESDAVSVMINEEDHIRIQGLLPGLALESAAERAFQVDDRLGRTETLAFSPQLGYLTRCPTNAGTGMRASVMMHLPALARTRQMESLSVSMAKLGVIIRAAYGEGRQSPCAIYLISNQITLGRTEADILQMVSGVASQIISKEQEAREKLRAQDEDDFIDRIMRAYGLSTHARIIPIEEFMQWYSDIRLGAAMGLLPIPLSEIDALLLNMQKGTLSWRAGRTLTRREADILRAEEMRLRLTQG